MRDLWSYALERRCPLFLWMVLGLMLLAPALIQASAEAAPFIYTLF